MVEDHLIEKNNGLNGMSADDGGSFDLDENEDQGSDSFTTALAQYTPHDDHPDQKPNSPRSKWGFDDEGYDEHYTISLHLRDGEDVDSQMISPSTVIGAAGTEGSMGSDAFTPLLEPQYKPHDDHLGLPRHRRTNVSSSEDDQHQETHIQNDDPSQLTLMTKRPSPWDEEYSSLMDNLDEEYSFQRLNPWDEEHLYNSRNKDEVSQMISPPPTVIAAAGTEGSMGSDAFTPLLEPQYKPHDNHLGLPRHRRTNVSSSEDDQHQETHIQNDDPSQLTLMTKRPSPWDEEYSSLMDNLDEEYSFQRLNPWDEEHLYNSWNKDEVSQMISPRPTVIAAAGTEGSMGSDAFTPLLEPQYKPHDDHLGLPRHRRTNVSYSEDDQHQETHIQNDDPSQLTLMTKRPSPWDEEYSSIMDNPDEEYFSQRRNPRDDELLYNSGNEDEVSQMISPRPTVIGAAWTEQRSLDTHRIDNMPGGDSNDERSLDTHRIDNMPGGDSNDERKGWDFEWILVIASVVLESMSAIFTQLSSKQKPQYALIGVLLSYLALLTCIFEIIYEGHRQIPIQRGNLSNNRSQRSMSFATLNNIVAFACALGECVVTTINYRFEGLIKINVLSIILANGVLFSKILKYRDISISFKKSR